MTDRSRGSQSGCAGHCSFLEHGHACAHCNDYPMTSGDTTSEADRIRDQVLLELRHEDDKQVFEVWWSVNSTFPALRLSDRLRLAEGIVADLLDAGVASLYRMNYSQQQRAEIEDQRAALLDEATWLPLNDTSDRIWIEATEWDNR